MAIRRRKRNDSGGDGDLEMTPMIDVVFQLLVYFVVTIKPVDVSAHLDVFRPAAQAAPSNQQPPKMIQIKIFRGDITMNDRSVDMASLGKVLEQLGALSKTQTVTIMCARDSEHNDLIEVLDRCSKAGLENLSVMSMN